MWTVDAGHRLIGTDLAGIELRCLAHYMQDEEWQEELLKVLRLVLFYPTPLVGMCFLQMALTLTQTALFVILPSIITSIPRPYFSKILFQKLF